MSNRIWQLSNMEKNEPLLRPAGLKMIDKDRDVNQQMIIDWYLGEWMPGAQMSELMELMKLQSTNYDCEEFSRSLEVFKGNIQMDSFHPLTGNLQEVTRGKQKVTPYPQLLLVSPAINQLGYTIRKLRYYYPNSSDGFSIRDKGCRHGLLILWSKILLGPG